MFKELTTCRLCGGPFYSESLKLADTPLANELYTSKALAVASDRFPLLMVMCSICKHVQLKYIIAASRLFSNYIYKSGTSGTFRRHFEDLALKIQSIVGTRSLVVEIGSNDGTLLAELARQQLVAVGVEPSAALAMECQAKGQLVYQSFLDEEVASMIMREFGLAKLIIGNNVFAHIDDLGQAVDLIYTMLDDNGTFVFEVAYLQALVSYGLFDTVYHEHMSYHSVTSLAAFLLRHNFIIYEVEEISMHGGSIRVFASKDLSRKQGSSVLALIEKETIDDLNSPSIFHTLKVNIEKLRESVEKEFSLFDENVQLIGFGAPAKVVTFLSEMNLEHLQLTGIIDDNPEKQGKFLPGSGYPILSLNEIRELVVLDSRRTICLIFPWNLSDELIRKLEVFMPESSGALSFFPKISRVDF